MRILQALAVATVAAAVAGAMAAAATAAAAAAADPARSKISSTFQLLTAEYYSVPVRFRGEGEGVSFINQDRRLSTYKLGKHV